MFRPRIRPQPALPAEPVRLEYARPGLRSDFRHELRTRSRSHTRAELAFWCFMCAIAAGTHALLSVMFLVAAFEDLFPANGYPMVARGLGFGAMGMPGVVVWTAMIRMWAVKRRVK